MAAHNVLINYKKDQAVVNPSAGTNSEVLFAQTDVGDGGNNGAMKSRRDRSRIQCWKCQQFGHFSWIKSKCTKGGYKDAEDKVEQLMIDNGSTDGISGTNGAGEAEVHNDEGCDTKQAKEEEDGYEVITGMQEQEEDYKPSNNVWTVHISFAQNTIVAAHMGRRRLPPWWVLLENFLTVHIFGNFNSGKMRAVCAVRVEPDINSRRHITAVKPF